MLLTNNLLLTVVAFILMSCNLPFIRGLNKQDFLLEDFFFKLRFNIALFIVKIVFKTIKNKESFLVITSNKVH